MPGELLDLPMRNAFREKPRNRRCPGRMRGQELPGAGQIAIRLENPIDSRRSQPLGGRSLSAFSRITHEEIINGLCPVFFPNFNELENFLRSPCGNRLLGVPPRFGGTEVEVSGART